MRISLLTLAGLLCAAAPLCSSADSAVSSLSGIASDVVPSSEVIPDVYTPSSFVMIANRARTLGGKISPGGTLFFSVRDSDLIGKSPGEIAQSLSPPAVKRDQRVRDVEILIETRHPIVAATDGKKPVEIGVATIHAKPNAAVTVNSHIYTGGITVVRK